ncbi:ORF198 [Staphylococcus phage 42E]|uniref:ORF198 n=1 Tax=Staphylococcus phage 42E TaxID=2908113 RepID=Q4ZCV3_9CAUD|nr:ORF198 [Staphylococcus phage 42E]AAX91191.1 ORF198 [Staphylococcus phage 42E]
MLLNKINKNIDKTIEMTIHIFTTPPVLLLNTLI